MAKSNPVDIGGILHAIQGPSLYPRKIEAYFAAQGLSQL
jgi:hypothetical protein